ncbi:MAG TPA: hypothetical protein VEJ17_00965 [Candidatus Nitrosotalea sp.]|nr:hypothetical protein [Candidatus Nitrosotalea sp.]
MPIRVASGLSVLDQKIGQQRRGDLDTIVSNTLKKKPAERYPSVTAFAREGTKGRGSLVAWPSHRPRPGPAHSAGPGD